MVDSASNNPVVTIPQQALSTGAILVTQPLLSPVKSGPAGSGSNPSGNSTLGVSQKTLTKYDYVLNDRKDSRKIFRQMIVDASTKVNLNPGLLAVNLIRETNYTDYLGSGKVSSFLIGTDDYFDKLSSIKAKVQQESEINWDRGQIPVPDTNETEREVKSIFFDSGKDGLLASAVYLKHGEIILREHAQSLGGDFDSFAPEVRFALTRLAFHAGIGRAKKNMQEFIVSGKDILVRRAKSKSGPQRKATISAAQAIHISNSIFGVVP